MTVKKASKKVGKTEVYPFWFLEDVKNMLEYFEMKEMWHWTFVFNMGVLLGRRVGDTLSFKWSDLFYENGRNKDEANITEQKTGKNTRLYICGAAKIAIQNYVDKVGVSPVENYHDFIITTDAKSNLLKERSNYTDIEYNQLMNKAIQSQAAAYRKQFKQAADVCGIKYPVSTHSTRKTFGYWSVKLHPYDVTTIDKLQGIFGHSDRSTTLKYVGITRDDEKKIYNDIGDMLVDIKAGKKPIIKNSPVIPLKSDDFRELLSLCWDAGKNGEDKFEALNNIINLAEECMV